MQRRVDVLALVDAVRHKARVEGQKIIRGIHGQPLLHDGVEHPHPSRASKIILPHTCLMQEEPLHLDGSERGVAHDVHVLFAVEQDGVDALLREEPVVLPCVFVDARLLPVLVVGQGEGGALPLEDGVGSIVEDEVVEQFVCFQRLVRLLGGGDGRVVRRCLHRINHLRERRKRPFCSFPLAARSGAEGKEQASGHKFLHCQPYLFSFARSFSSMSTVMDSKSYFGFQSHSSRAQVSSRQSGQLSAMACFSGSI